MRIKLCGVADEDGLRAVGAGRPDAVGFVLAPSVRQVDVATLERLLGWVPEGVQRWAVFREPTPDILRELAGLPLTGVQAYATWSGAGLPEGFAWLPAFRDGPDLLDRLAAAGFDGRPHDVRGLVGAFLVDSAAGGGSGTAADWDRAAQAAALGPMVLAGGLTPENVGEAIRRVRPYGVDVSSGIEARPGVKDGDRVRGFVEAVRGA